MGEIVYRNPIESDAKTIVDFFNQTGGESIFLSFEKDEYPLGVEAQREKIKSLEGNVNNNMLLAFDGVELAGLSTITSSSKVKSRHEAELGIIVARKYQKQGIGRALIEKQIEWCRNNGVTTRIRLDVSADNLVAVSLYLKFGFVVEGCCRNDTLLNGKYYDTYIMGMMI